MTVDSPYYVQINPTGRHWRWLVVRAADDEVMALATGVLTERDAKRQAAQALVYHERQGSI